METEEEDAGVHYGGGDKEDTPSGKLIFTRDDWRLHQLTCLPVSSFPTLKYYYFSRYSWTFIYLYDPLTCLYAGLLTLYFNNPYFSCLWSFPWLQLSPSLTLNPSYKTTKWWLYAHGIVPMYNGSSTLPAPLDMCLLTGPWRGQTFPQMNISTCRVSGTSDNLQKWALHFDIKWENRKFSELHIFTIYSSCLLIYHIWHEVFAQ